MKRNVIINIFILIFLFLSISCNKELDSLEKTFTKNEVKEIDKIIDYYDNYVLLLTDKSLTIEEAYISFIENNSPKITERGDKEAFFINSKDRNVFLKTIDFDLLLEIYDKQDSVIIMNVKTKDRFKVYPPFHFSLNRYGKFSEFLNDLAAKKQFYKNFQDDIMNAGDISPANIATLLYEYEDIDFSKREERFVFIISFLRYEDDLYEYYVYKKNGHYKLIDQNNKNKFYKNPK